MFDSYTKCVVHRTHKPNWTYKLNVKLGDRIRQLRENTEQYKSLRQFAAALGKSPSWVSKVERNEECPGDETLLQIAKLLSVDAGELFFLAKRIEPDIHSGITSRYTELSGLLRTIQSVPSDKVEQLQEEARKLIGDHGEGQSQT